MAKIKRTSPHIVNLSSIKPGEVFRYEYTEGNDVFIRTNGHHHNQPEIVECVNLETGARAAFAQTVTVIPLNVEILIFN